MKRPAGTRLPRRRSHAPIESRRVHVRRWRRGSRLWRKLCASPARTMATTTARSIARRASAMPAFDYAALDERGQTRHGRLDAADPGPARRQLERQRLVPVRVGPARQIGSAAGRERGGQDGVNWGVAGSVTKKTEMKIRL